MKSRTLIFRSLLFYRRTHVGVLLGAVLSTAVLVGALMVGDSVRGSLEQMALTRLGRTQLALESGDRFFSTKLAEKLAGSLKADVAPVLKLKAIAAADGGQLRINGVQVLGVDSRFWETGNTADPFTTLKTTLNAEEAVINSRLAARLDLKQGDEFLLRLEKINLMPGDVAVSSQDNATQAFRLTVKAIAHERDFGRFSLRANQTAPCTVFLPHHILAHKMELDKKANVLLLAGQEKNSIPEPDAAQALAEAWTLEDTGLSIRTLPQAGGLELVSNRVFIESAIEESALQTRHTAKPIFSYFVNTIAKKGDKIPYSFVSSPGAPLVPPNMGDHQIIINQWAADDLNAAAGDTVRVTYFLMGSDYRLEEKTTSFTVHSVVPIHGPAADRNLTPIFPGLSEADNCRDWDPGIPVDLKRIRQKDEDYWDTYKGIPKAFVTLDTARRLWGNRFGSATAIRFTRTTQTPRRLAASVMRRLEPSQLGLGFRPVRREGLQAGSEAVDFGQLFIGLSFFIIAAGLLLTGLLFALGAEQRAEETGTLLALGFPPNKISRNLFAEGAVLAVLGGLLGTLCGIAYNWTVLYFLGTLWRGAVGTSALYTHLEPVTLLIGATLGIITAALTMALAVRKQTKKPVLQLYGGGTAAYAARPGKKNRLNTIVMILSLAGVVVILALVAPGKGKQAAGAFWGAGFLMLTAGLAFCRLFLMRLNTSAENLRKRSFTHMKISKLGRRNAARKQGRSLATIALLAFGVFIVIAVGANRHGTLKDADNRNSGTGGFAFFAQTTMPVQANLNVPKNRRAVGLNEEFPGVTLVQLRFREGDDASCLNLNKVRNPSILGVPVAEFSSRRAFSFAQLADGVNREDPWSALDRELADGVIPVFADQNVIVWGLGKSVGDILTYSDEKGKQLKLKLMGGLTNSIFQGNLLMARRFFIPCFPSVSGSRVFLIDAPPGQREAIQKDLIRGMEDYGLELTSTAERLAAFNSVENTYLSIFMALGGLGLLIGTLGMGIIVSRNVMERRSELALMRTLGFNRGDLNRMLWGENLFLLAAGVICGTLSALTAVIPALLSPGANIPYIFLALTLAAVILSGAAWSKVATQWATKGDLLASLRNE